MEPGNPPIPFSLSLSPDRPPVGRLPEMEGREVALELPRFLF